MRAGNTKVALVVDDLASVRPWSPRYLRIYGTAELVGRPGQFGPGPYMRIAPTVSWSFNLDGRSFTMTARSSRAAPSTTPPIRREADPHPARPWSEPTDAQRGARHAPAADHTEEIA